MYAYNISKVADEAAFERACHKIEAGLHNLKKNKLLEDVDGTLIQVYITADGKRIKLVNDHEVDAVYVRSEVNIDEALGKAHR